MRKRSGISAATLASARTLPRATRGADPSRALTAALALQLSLGITPSGAVAATTGSAAGVTATVATAKPATAATSCSNPRLPVAILGGPAPFQSGKSLALVSARAPAATLQLAVAGTEQDRELGLMCVTALAPQRGMIFVFKKASLQEFWMKRTLIPLDMVWVDAAGRVDTVAPDVPASSLDESDDAVARRSGSGLYVIELAAGEAQRDGVARGVRLVLPRLQASD